MNEVQPIRDRKDIDRMKNALNGRDRLLFIFGINSGLRISDLLKLKVGDVRGKDSIVIRETKTGKAKRFIFNSAIQSALRQIPHNAHDTDYVFPSRNGQNVPIHRVTAYRILNEGAIRAGIYQRIGAIGTHSMRKSFGYHAYQNGTDLSLLQSIFNHTSQSVTLRYIGINQDRIDEVYSNVNL